MCIDTITWKIKNLSFYVFNLNIHTKTGSCWFFFWYHPIFSTTLIRSLLLFPPTRIALRDYVSQFFRIIYSLNVVPNWIFFQHYMLLYDKFDVLLPSKSPWLMIWKTLMSSLVYVCSFVIFFIHSFAWIRTRG